MLSGIKRSRRAMSPVHTNAGAIDIGATLHVAAVGPDRDPVPVRSFGTFASSQLRHALALFFDREKTFLISGE
jgi:transposase